MHQKSSSSDNSGRRTARVSEGESSADFACSLFFLRFCLSFLVPSCRPVLLFPASIILVCPLLSLVVVCACRLGRLALALSVHAGTHPLQVKSPSIYYTSSPAATIFWSSERPVFSGLFQEMFANSVPAEPFIAGSSCDFCAPLCLGFLIIPLFPSSAHSVGQCLVELFWGQACGKTLFSAQRPSRSILRPH